MQNLKTRLEKLERAFKARGECFTVHMKDGCTLRCTARQAIEHAFSQDAIRFELDANAGGQGELLNLLNGLIDGAEVVTSAKADE